MKKVLFILFIILLVGMFQQANAAVPITNSPNYPSWLVSLSNWLFG